MDRRNELRQLQRSIAMLAPGTQALSREQALGLLDELDVVEHQLRTLRLGLRRLLDEPAPQP